MLKNKDAPLVSARYDNEKGRLFFCCTKYIVQETKWIRKWFGMAGGFDCTEGGTSCITFHKLSVYEFMVRYLNLFCEGTATLEFLFV